MERLRLRLAGGRSGPIVRFSGCDLDRAQNGTCQFRVSIGARSTVVPQLFDGTVAVGGRQRPRAEPGAL